MPIDLYTSIPIIISTDLHTINHTTINITMNTNILINISNITHITILTY